MTDQNVQVKAPLVSIAIFAWNEERAISSTLESLLGQTLFKELHARGDGCEILCVLNGCTDNTARVAAEVLSKAARTQPCATVLSSRIIELAQRGKINAWNQFVHRLSAPEAQILFMLDADILIHLPETLWNMLRVLETDPEASVAVDVPRKHLVFRGWRSPWREASMAMSRITQSASAQLCGQLYAMRARVARSIVLPLDLPACEDGLLKSLVCTDFLTHQVWPRRIRQAAGAEHTFEAYTSVKALLKNQKRQIMGQTFLHVLIDKYLQSLPAARKAALADLIREKDALDHGWLRRLVFEHLQATRFFWRLYPGLATQPFQRLRRLSLWNKARCLPAAGAGCAGALVAAFLARRSLQKGCTDYWPKAERLGLSSLAPRTPARAEIGGK